MTVVQVIWLHGRTASGAWQLKDSDGRRLGRPYETEAQARAALWADSERAAVGAEPVRVIKDRSGSCGGSSGTG